MSVFLLFLFYFAAWRFRWRDYRLPAKLLASSSISAVEEGRNFTSTAPNGPIRPVLSVIIPCHNQCEALEANLPAILEQHFAPFEVVVVNEASTDATLDVLHRLENTYPHLRHTFVSRTARYASLRPASMMIGLRSARAAWVVVTGADCRPISDNWLRVLTTACGEQTDGVGGLTLLRDDGTRTARRAAYEHLRVSLMLMRACAPKRSGAGAAIGLPTTNVMLRRSLLLSNDRTEAMTASLALDPELLPPPSTDGEADCILSPHPDGIMQQDMPHISTVYAGLSARKTAVRHLTHRGRRFLWRDAAAGWAICLFPLALLSHIALRFTEWPVALPPLYRWVSDGMALLLVLAFFVTPYWALRSTTRALGLRSYSLSFILKASLHRLWPFCRHLQR